jgi:hypothetical protein
MKDGVDFQVQTPKYAPHAWWRNLSLSTSKGQEKKMSLVCRLKLHTHTHPDLLLEVIQINSKTSSRRTVKFLEF